MRFANKQKFDGLRAEYLLVYSNHKGFLENYLYKNEVFLKEK